MSCHTHEIEDTRKRSLLKALTGNGLEAVLDTLIIGTILTWLGMPIIEAAGLGISLSVTIEFLCFVTNYCNDRIWNRTQWGRTIKDVKE